MLFKAIAALGLSLVLSAAASAQVIFEPVQSQYRESGETFYYGGSNPRVLAYARATADLAARADTGYFHRSLIGRPAETVYVDGLPRQNASVYGYSSVDARNQAYSAVPRFFRMADLLASAVLSQDGLSLVVPAQAPGTIDIRPSRKPAGPGTAPATQPKPVLIIPKKLLEPGAVRDKLAALP